MIKDDISVHYKDILAVPLLILKCKSNNSLSFIGLINSHLPPVVNTKTLTLLL